MSTILLLAACGDNITRPDARDPVGPNGPTEQPSVGPGTCVDVEDIATCPQPDSPDASVSEPQADAGLSDEQHAACCHALLDGTPPDQECGYPPGLCKNGQKDMFCKAADGSDAKFTLCNP